MKNIKKREIWLPILTLLIGFIISPFQTFFDKIFSDLATKENISEITEKVEEVKSVYIEQIDSLREQLKRESEVLSKQRDLYSKLALSTRVFLEGNDTHRKKEDFSNNYSEMWLWASDEVLQKLNVILAYHILMANGKTITQKQLKESYSNFILEMRKDVGFSNTSLTNKDFLYFKFTE